jgi:hypothetical protein
MSTVGLRAFDTALRLIKHSKDNKVSVGALYHSLIHRDCALLTLNELLEGFGTFRRQ